MRDEKLLTTEIVGHIFHKRHTNAQIPNDWMKSVTVTTFKKGEKQNPETICWTCFNKYIKKKLKKY